MDILRWWTEIRASTRDWLVANNGATLPAEMADEIRGIGGFVDPRGSLRDEEIDWIEATANGETV